MADLNAPAGDAPAASTCCAPEEQATCCKPAEKAGCCRPKAAICGCSKKRRGRDRG